MAAHKTQKIAIFGGSFDPVQKAHTKIIKHLSKKFDKVIIVPSFVSPFKLNAEPESAVHRIEMLKLIALGLENVEISKFEIESEGVSFTYKTLEHFADMYPHDELYFTIGSDMLKGLNKWAEFDILKNLASFYVFEREGYLLEDKLIARLQKKGVQLVFSNEKIADISSSFARVAVAFNSGEAVEKSVQNYINENRLYSDYDEIIRSYDVFNLSKERREHTLRALKAGIMLAKRFKADVEKTILALLLHDIGKYATVDILKENNIKLTKKIKELPKDIVHAFVSALIAKKYLHINDSSVLGAIKSHTTGKRGMGKLAKIVYLADIIEQGRDFDGVEEIRELAKTSLDEAVVKALRGTIEALTIQGKEVYPLTIEAYEYLKEKLAKKGKGSVKQATLEPEALSKTTQKAVTIPLARVPDGQNTDEPYDLAYTIAQLISDKKGRDIVIVDLRGKTIIADYFVIASVTSTTAVKAVTDYVDEKLSKQYSIEPLRRDIDAKWAAVDYSSVILHIQLEETRNFYNIERLWADGTNINRFDK